MSEPFRTSTILYEQFRIDSLTSIVDDNEEYHGPYSILGGWIVVGVIVVEITILFWFLF